MLRESMASWCCDIMRVCYLSSTYTCHIGAGASNALTATADKAPVDAYVEAVETEYTTGGMMSK